MPPFDIETGAAEAASPLLPASPPASLSVVPSSDPAVDARALAGLLPSARYSLEEELTVVMVGRGGGSAKGEVGEKSQQHVILLVQSFDERQVRRIPPSYQHLRAAAAASSFPTAALVIDADDISSAEARLRRDGSSGGIVMISSYAEGVPNRPVDGGDDDAAVEVAWCVLRLPGGAALTCSSPSLPWSAGGRRELARAAVAAAAAAAEEGGGAAPSIVQPSEVKAASVEGRRDLSLTFIIKEVDNVPTIGDWDAHADAVSPPPPSYDFPSLSMKILSGTGGEENKVIPGFRNKLRGMPVDNDLFEGKVLVMMKPPNNSAVVDDNPYWDGKVSSKKKPPFEVQIQGRFKRTPVGTVYCGAEITEEMKLGFVSKGLCNMLLKLLSTWVPADMHYSFGTKTGEDLPHIVFTAWSFFDRLVVTEPGGTPPPMGEPFPESDGAASKRRSSAGRGEWRSGVTYSMSISSMYLDLPTWHLRSLPVMKDTDLHTFWGNSLLRIVIYEKVGTPSQSKRHLMKDNKYLLTIQTEFLGVLDNGGEGIKVENRDSLPRDKTKNPATFQTDDSIIGKDFRAIVDDGFVSDTSRMEETAEEEEDDSSESDETAFFDSVETESVLSAADFGSFVASGVPAAAKRRHNRMLEGSCRWKTHLAAVGLRCATREENSSRIMCSFTRSSSRRLRNIRWPSRWMKQKGMWKKRPPLAVCP